MNLIVLNSLFNMVWLLIVFFFAFFTAGRSKNVRIKSDAHNNLSAQRNERLDLSKKYLQVCGIIIFPIALVSVALCIIKPEYVVGFDLAALLLVLLICIKTAIDHIRAY